MVPAELKRLPQWVCWRLEERDGKPTKVPYRADGAGLAAVNQPDSWSTARAAYDAWQADGFSGIGLVLTAGDPYCGVDLDDCVIGDQVADWAQAIVDRFRSYTELTPSGNGLRIWIRGALPGSRRRKGKIEVYDRERYFTLTGRQLPGTPEAIEERQAELEAFCAELFPPTPPAAESSTSSRLSDFEVLDLARKASNGAKVDQLLRGSTAGYQSGSEADLALVSLLAFYTQDAGQLERLWRGSALWREKAERQDYREKTITKALAELADVYSPGDPGGEIRHGSGQAPPPPPGATEAPEEAQPWLTPLGSYLTGPPEVLDWLVDGLLIKGGIAVFGAKPKVAKTTLLTQFTLAIARGVPFLGRKSTPGPVIYLALEEDRGRVVERFRKLGATPADPVHVHVGQAGPEGFVKLATAIRELGAVMAVIDPIQRLTRLENINDYSEVSNATDPLIAVARETGCAVVFSHHLGKLDRGSGDQILGSTALFGSVDTAVIIRKREEDSTRTLETVQRYGSALEPMVLGYSTENGSAWIEGPAEEFEAERDQVSALKFIADQLEPMTQSQIIEGLGIQWGRALRAINGLVSAHHVERTGEGRRGNPFTFRALVRPEELPTAFLNSNPFSLPPGKESGNESGNESISPVLPEGPHGFPALLKEVGQGILHHQPPPPPPPAVEEVENATNVVPLRPPSGSVQVGSATCPYCDSPDYRPVVGGRRLCKGCGHHYLGPKEAKP